MEREEVVIERKPASGHATGQIKAGDIGQGEDLVIPVREEQVKVGKEAVVTEEVSVGKRTVHDTERVSGQVRKEEVRVDKEGDVDVRTRGSGVTGCPRRDTQDTAPLPAEPIESALQA